jgi:hypothetical protein
MMQIKSIFNGILFGPDVGWIGPIIIYYPFTEEEF